MPGIEKLPLADFSGGWLPRLASTDFSERQWATIKGLVIEDETRLRSQWACQKIGTTSGFDQIATVDSRIIARKASNGSFWIAGYVPTGAAYGATAVWTWTEITAITPSIGKNIVCSIPLKDASAEGFLEGLLINSRDPVDNAHAVWIKPSDGSVQVKTWTGRWPSTGGTDNIMPPATVGTMWGSFLVLADIMWFHDASLPLSSSNMKIYPNAMWFSTGGDIDKWDPLDVELTPPKGMPEGMAIHSMIPVDAGLLVFEPSGVTLLRGTGDNYTMEPLRRGVGGTSPAKAWPHTGSVVWVDRQGQVWHTNGENFVRLDVRNFDFARIPGAHDNVCPFGEYLLVERAGRLFALRAFDNDAAWTELVPVTAATAATTYTRKMIEEGDRVYFLDGDGIVWRWLRGGQGEVGETERGKTNGVAITSTLATRTVESGGGHEKTMWHRFGVRGKGPGTLVSIKLRPGPALDTAQPTYTWTLNETVGTRYEQVVPAHGPSVEASAELSFTGDVQVEQCAWWAHRGRGSR